MSEFCGIDIGDVNGLFRIWQDYAIHREPCHLHADLKSALMNYAKSKGLTEFYFSCRCDTRTEAGSNVMLTDKGKRMYELWRTHRALTTGE